MRPKVLVTGANGFIGSRLIERIQQMNYDIRVISRDPSDAFDSIQCDFLNDAIPKNALDSVEIVFHLAGLAHDFRTNHDVSNLYEKINVDATVQLAKLAINSGVSKFIFVSSVKAGGKSISNQCINESNQGLPDGEYGKSKRKAELSLLELSQDADMEVVIVRPSLVYGKGMKGNLNLMLSGIKSGWFPPLPKVQNYRSMIHLDDLIDALLMLSLDRRADGEIFIATDGHTYSSRDIYEAMCTNLGKKIPSWYFPLWIFKIISKLSKGLNYKVEKLFGNELYSSKKLENIGFKAKRTFKEFDENETFF